MRGAPKGTRSTNPWSSRSTRPTRLTGAPDFVPGTSSNGSAPGFAPANGEIVDQGLAAARGKGHDPLLVAFAVQDSKPAGREIQIGQVKADEL